MIFFCIFFCKRPLKTISKKSYWEFFEKLGIWNNNNTTLSTGVSLYKIRKVKQLRKFAFKSDLCYDKLHLLRLFLNLLQDGVDKGNFFKLIFFIE